MSKTNATVIWKMLVFPFNVHQVPEARAMCNDMGIIFEPVTSERDVDFVCASNSRNICDA